MTMGWRELDGMASTVTMTPATAEGPLLLQDRMAPPTIQGIIPVDPDTEYIALWFDSGSRVVSRARVVAWRISGPQAWPCTLLPTEPSFLKRPDGVVFDIATGARWDNEGDWMAAQP